MKAKAVVFTAPNTVQYREINCPEPGPDDVVVQVTQAFFDMDSFKGAGFTKLAHEGPSALGCSLRPCTEKGWRMIAHKSWRSLLLIYTPVIQVRFRTNDHDVS